MAELVNLRRVRRARDRAAAEAEAAANRARHGRTRGERTAETTEAVHRDRTLDGAKLTRDSEPGE